MALAALPLGAQKVTIEQAAEMTAAELRKLTPEQVRDLVDQMRDVQVATTATQPFFRGAPGTSSGSPSAFGAAWRDGFVGGGIQQARQGGDTDGAMAGGFGLGNPRDAVGLEVVVASLSSFRSGLFDRTALSFKAHHMVSNSAAIAVGVENAMVSSGSTDGAVSVYVAASKAIAMPEGSVVQQVTLSGGLGNGRFRFEKDALADRKTVNVFASVGAQLHPQASVLADWSGQDLALGLSLVPIKAFPVIITPAITDLTGQNGNDPRFVMGFGIGMRF
jgi:hypothetical protein